MVDLAVVVLELGDCVDLISDGTRDHWVVVRRAAYVVAAVYVVAAMAEARVEERAEAMPMVHCDGGSGP